MGIATSSFLTSLIDAHEDLMSNLYLVQFFPPANGLATSIAPEKLRIRVKSFKAPVATQATHRVDFGTTHLDVPSPSIDLNKSFDLTFRLDSNYEVYKWLKSWQAANLAEQSSFAGNHILGEGSAKSEDESTKGLIIKVFTLADKLDNPNDITYTKTTTTVTYEEGGTETKEEEGMGADWVELYTFNYCWISAIKGLDYSYDSADVLEVTATIHYLDYSEPNFDTDKTKFI